MPEVNAPARRSSKVQITLDTETTGLEAQKGDRIIEIGCVRLNGRAMSDDEKDYLQIFVNPERDIPAEVTAIHGITNEKVANCPTFAQTADRFIEFIRGAELLIHNAEFDVGFLNMELERCGKGRLEDYVTGIVDTIDIARELYPGRRVSLDSLCILLQIDNSARIYHGALLDSQILAEVYLAMTRGQGQINLDEVDDPNLRRMMPDASKFRVIRATPEELIEHEKMLDKADKQSKSICAWRKLSRPAQESGES